MRSLKIYAIIGSIIFVLSIIGFGLYQYKCKIQLEQQLEVARQTIEMQQTYIVEKDKTIKDIEKKYREKLNQTPDDECGNTIVSDKIKEWIQQ